MAMLLGKKIGMTQVYDESGKMIPVTVIQAGPCTVTQVKTPEVDGYSALQLGFDDIKKSRVKKPAQGHSKNAETNPKRFVREYRLGAKEDPAHAIGEQINVGPQLSLEHDKSEIAQGVHIGLIYPVPCGI